MIEQRVSPVINSNIGLLTVLFSVAAVYMRLGSRNNVSGPFGDGNEQVVNLLMIDRFGHFADSFG